MSGKYKNGIIRMSIAGKRNHQNEVVSIVIKGKSLDEVLAALNENAKRDVVDDIEALTAEQLEALRCGDVVIKKTGTERHAYHVAYKDDTKHECALVYCDAWNVEELYYDKSVGSAWSLIEKQITPIAMPNATPNE